jgi:acyl-CoA synthetase (AMP-forming)/AMP-acid ligase II
VIFSSGTTGEPKGIVHSHSNAMHELDAMIEGYGARGLRKHHLILTLAHVSGLYRSLLMPFCTGGTVTMRRLFDPQTFWFDVCAQQVEFVQMVPSHIAMLNRAPHGPASGRTSSLRFVGTASAYLPPKEQKTFEERFGVPILQGYGLTECTCGITLNSLDPKIRRPGVVGRPLSVNEIRLVDNAGLEVESGELGEVQVRGKNIAVRFLGYAGPSFQDGWLKTGDMGRMEADGNIVLIGRTTNIVNRGAYKIYTREVEDALGALKGIEEAAVIGVPHPLLGEDLVAFVTPEQAPGPLQLLGALRRTLSSYKIPSRIIPIAEIPKNKMGKPLRESLVQRLVHVQPGAASRKEEDIAAQICRIIADLFALNPSAVDASCSRDRVPQWDSLGHVQVLAAIEQTFGIRLADEGAVVARTVADLVDLVRYEMKIHRTRKLN